MSNSKSTQVKNGRWKEFNKHAILIAEGSYIDNKKNGVWKEYYDHTGSIMIEEEYHHGIQHGRFSSYHPNGSIFSEGQFVHGLREGYFRVFDEGGNHIRTLWFINNILIEDNEEHQHHNEELRREAG